MLLLKSCNINDYGFGWVTVLGRAMIHTIYYIQFESNKKSLP